MLTNHSKSILKVTLVAVLTLPILLVIPNGTVEATPSISRVSPVALTPPPPPERHSIQSLKALQNIYQAVGGITPVGGLSAFVNTTTKTYTKMNKLTVQYRLERWTGTSWVTYRSESATKNNVSALDANSKWTVITGYYYRVVSIHSASDGSTTETTTHITDNVLF